MKKIFATFTLLLSLTVLLRSQDPGQLFAQAEKLYSEGDFSGAASLYSKLWNEGYTSEKLLYNAGNAFFKSGDFASAILFYERARLVSPADEDINYNLGIARSRLTDKFESVPKLFFIKWFDFVSLITSSDAWAVAALVMFIAFAVLAVLFLTRGRDRGRLLSFWFSAASLFLSLALVSLALRNNSLVRHNRTGVIMAPAVTGRSAPGESGSELFVIHSGTTVRSEQVLGDYVEVRLPDGNKGWIKKESLEML